jgi:acetyl-CoA carboxylase carboxyl transferase subunit beta
MNWFTQLIRPKIRSFTQKQDVPDHLWTKCTTCAQMLFSKDLEDALCVCRHCGAHMKWSTKARLSHIFKGEDKYQVLPTPALTGDPLQFRDQKKYTDRLKEARARTQHSDALVVAFGHIQRMPMVVACFDFAFIGGSMGMAVGEGLVIAARHAVLHRAALLLIPSSGGARMQEGLFSLMQMPRSVIAVHMVKEARLPVILWLTNPTTGGVAASFASLGDITLAEPGAIIGFTGARVIQETLRQPLPLGFQTAEFQKQHGFVDQIVPRFQIAEVLDNMCTVFAAPRFHTPSGYAAQADLRVTSLEMA